MNKEFVTFAVIKDAIRDLELPQFDKIVVLTRGGLTPASLISQKQNTRDYNVLCFQSYMNKKKEGLKLLSEAQINLGRVLIVDDIADTGETLEKALELYPNAKTFCIHYKPHSKVKPDYYLWETDKWIIYDWEFNEL